MVKFAQVTYGSQGDSGSYTYIVSDSTRAGSVINPAVKHHLSHKIYGTMGIVQSTSKETSYDGNVQTATRSSAREDTGRFAKGYKPAEKNANGEYTTQKGQGTDSKYAQKNKAENVKNYESYDSYANRTLGGNASED